jgi:DNA helicase-2/ATP-dependent DNA helicase PcrA
MNIGLAKGRTYDRVLIFPTKPMKEYLKTQEVAKAGDIAKLYVAVTRARFSVAFVVD